MWLLENEEAFEGEREMRVGPDARADLTVSGRASALAASRQNVSLWEDSSGA